MARHKKNFDYFRHHLMSWHEDIDRNLPWKNTDDPYKIWISEIILQQTRVAQGQAYYKRITAAFPGVQDLASASEDEVLSLWKGLGYYARARNLHSAAKQIVTHFDGVFPTTYEAILSLKGVGPYTAAAIASFAYNLPYPVIDGNVYRVLSRYFGISTPIDTTEGRKAYKVLAQNCYDSSAPAEYNQAIMDFGALQCTPALPSCSSCPLVERCTAYHQGSVDLLPVKSKKIEVKKRFFHYLIFQKEDQIYIEKRKAKDIWQGLYQPPLIEATKKLSRKALMGRAAERFNISDLEISSLKKLYTGKQRLTHRLIHGEFYYVRDIPPPDGGRWVSLSNFNEYGVPKIVDEFLNYL